MGKDWTQAKLSQSLTRDGLRVTRGWVASVETGRIPPHQEDLAVLARVLKKPLTYFVADSESAVVAESTVPYGALRVQPVPVVGTVGADTFEFAFDDPPLEYLPTLVEGSGARAQAAFKVRGACMEPDYHDGEYVIVAQTDTVPDGRPGVFRLDGGCTLKVPHRAKDHVELRPLNPKFPSLKIATSKLMVVGVVVGIFRKP